MTKGAKQLGQLFERPVQREVARRLAIHESYLSYLISGRRMPSIKLATRIQKQLGIPVVAWTEQASE